VCVTSGGRNIIMFRLPPRCCQLKKFQRKPTSRRFPITTLEICRSAGVALYTWSEQKKKRPKKHDHHQRCAEELDAGCFIPPLFHRAPPYPPLGVQFLFFFFPFNRGKRKTLPLHCAWVQQRGKSVAEDLSVQLHDVYAYKSFQNKKKHLQESVRVASPPRASSQGW
jgi:hypothetical protein